jgi:hypothetical protein
MKRVLLFAAAFVTISGAAFAQQTIPADPATTVVTPEPRSPLPLASRGQPPRILDEQGYFWNSDILRRGVFNGDTTRVDISVPYHYPGSNVERRGLGQLFSPTSLFALYDNVYSPTSWRVFDDTSSVTDQDYLDQFKGATDFTVDSVRFFLYKPDNNVPLNGGKFMAWRMALDPNTTAFNSKGLNLRRTSGALLGFPDYGDQPFQQDFTAEMIDATNNGTNIFRTTVPFDPPLSGTKGESILMMYINDDAPAVTPQPGDNSAEIQQMIGTLEYRTGNFVDTNLAGNINGKQALGAIMYHYTDSLTDWIYSGWNGHLFYTAKGFPAYLNQWMDFFGTVNITSGVQYHFGREADMQGLGNVTPNPVTSNARVPFSLTELSDVTIDLFDVNGRQVKNLVTAHRYVPGNYSVALPVEELQSGTYLIRMTAGSRVYTMKVNVAR